MSTHWLTSTQNGGIGEARTKAFLIDRFWILERSVDIEGADFIIQRRLTKESILDDRAPRMGVVQAKFYQSENTTHYIPKSYVLDANEKSRDEFFLIAHTGDEEMPRSFFLTATILSKDFQLKERNGTMFFALPGKTILGNSKYYVSNKKHILNRMERQLEFADLSKNRTFLTNIQRSSVNHSDILTEYREPIPNWWGDIPEEFKKLKETTHETMTNLERVHGLLKEIVDEVDPIRALSLLEYFSHFECNAGRDWSIKLPDLFDPEFVYVCQEHQRKLKNLQERGLLDIFLDLPKTLKLRIGPFLAGNAPVSANLVHEISITYSTKDLAVFQLAQQLIPVTDYFNVPEIINSFGHVEITKQQYSGFKDISTGTIKYYWLPGRYSTPIEYNSNQKVYFENAIDISVYRECAEQMYAHLE